MCARQCVHACGLRACHNFIRTARCVVRHVDLCAARAATGGNALGNLALSVGNVAAARIAVAVAWGVDAGSVR